jgi:hypothetical protein
MSWVDTLGSDKCKSVKLSEVFEYKENWNVIKEMTSRENL